MRVLLRGLLAVAMPAALLSLAPPSSAAASLPTLCKPNEAASATNPACQWVRATVTGVADGDTFDVREESGKEYRMRSIGINAMEIKSYHLTDRTKRVGHDCTAAPDGYAGHAVAAANRAEDLIRAAGGRVYLAAQDLSRTTSDNRPRRSVWTYANGVWTDVSLVLIKEGLALWLANPDEWAHTEYVYWTHRAAANRVGLYDRDKCGYGPSQDAKLPIWVNWDAEGSDSTNLNGEWVRIRNTGTTDVNIGGWWLRDALKSISPNPAYRFPAGTTIRAGSHLTLHVGSGTNTSSTLYWNQTGPVFNNVDYRRWQGEGAYLFDPQGDLRAWMTYPCRYRCPDPLRGKITVTARAAAPEHVDLTNTSSVTVNLQGHVLKEGAKHYHFLNSTKVAPGATLRVKVLGSPSYDTATVKHWGQPGYILSDSSDRVMLRNYADVLISCTRWGTTAPSC